MFSHEYIKTTDDVNSLKIHIKGDNHILEQYFVRATFEVFLCTLLNPFLSACYVFLHISHDCATTKLSRKTFMDCNLRS